MKKKIIYSILAIIIFTIMLLNIRIWIYGEKKQYINGMPGTTIVGTDKNRKIHWKRD